MTHGSQPAAIVVRFARMRPEAVAPRRMTDGAAGHDLAACLGDEVLEVPPLGRMRVPTGLRIVIPRGFEGQVRPRSGWADRAGVTVLNAPGTIDADYRGELIVLLVNLGAEPVSIRHGDRIAQLVIAPVVAAHFECVGDFDQGSAEGRTQPHDNGPYDGASGATIARGAGGFGSTGR